jgi:hypothetical protein
MPFPVRIKIKIKIRIKIDSQVNGDGQECPFHTTILVQSPRRSLRPTPQRFGCPSVGLAGVT